MPSITIRDTLRLALPPETTIAAGAAGMQNQVSWVILPRATPPVFSNLRGGELAIVSLAALRDVDDRLSLATLVERLAGVPIAGLGVIGEISPEASEAANSARVPLLRLPDGTDLRDAEREVQRLITDYDAQMERRAAQLGHVLTQRSLAGAGLQGLVDVLAERTGRGVGCFSASGELRAIRARGSVRVTLQTLQPSGHGSSHHLGQQVWTQPLGAGREQFGFLVMCGETLDDWDRIAAQQAASVLALEISKEQAVLAVEERVRADLVQTVLAGAPVDSEALQQRGRELGYNLRQPYVALLCAAGDTDGTLVGRTANAVSSALNALGVAAPLMRRADGVLCYLPVGERGQRAREIAEQIRTRLVGDMPAMIVAIGKEAATLTGWSRSLREAEQALMIGRQLLDNSRVLDFNDLGVYRLLLLLRESSELWEFYRHTLQPLVEYDRRQDAERSGLVRTLEVFFENLGNLAQTAESLHVHRNTLLYRLKRVHEITNLDLDDSEERLALWLALKVHRVLCTLEVNE